MTTLNLRYCEVLHEGTYYDVIIGVATLDEVNDVLQDWALAEIGEALTLPDELTKNQNLSDVFTSKDIDVNVYIKSAASGYLDAARTAGISGTAPVMPRTLVATKYVMPACTARLWTLPNAQGVFGNYNIPTASLTLTADAMNYIGIRYNAGVPEYYVYSNQDLFDYSTIIPVGGVLYWGSEIIPIPFGQSGDGMAEKLYRNQTERKEFSVLGNFTLVADGRYLELSALNVNAGTEDFALDAVDTSSPTTGYLYLFYKDSSQVWQNVDVSGLLENTNYQGDGIGLQALTSGEYVVQYLYRLVDEESEQIFSVLSGKFASLAAAKESDIVIDIPNELSKASVLIGRAITGQGASTTVIQKIQTASFGTVA